MDRSEQDDLRSIVETVLLVARLGEADLHGWWGSRAFGAAGRVVLKQRLPNTWRLAAAELAVESAASRHREVLSRPTAVHLFGGSWPVRRWTNAWVSEQKTQRPPDAFFEELASLGLDDITARLGRRQRPASAGSSTAVRLGTVSRAACETPSGLVAHVQDLATIYVGSSSDFVVPYFDMED